jgi:flagellin
MSSFSVNTNFGASVALQNLTRTASELQMTQSRISTGLAVSSTKDDSAAYTIAQTLRGDLGGLKSVTASLSRAKSVVDVAVAGGEQVSDILNQMEAKALQASDTGIDTNTRSAINRDFTALRDQITTIVNSSNFNGTNLLKAGGGTVDALKSTLDSDGATAGFQADTLAVGNVGLDLGGSVITVAASDVVSSAATAATMVDTIRTSKANLNTALSTIGSASRNIDGQMSFTSKLSDAVDAGVGKLVDADLAKESARFQALQVKQQLGVQALSIANQTPQTVLSLFR